MSGNSPTATAVGDTTSYVLGTEERPPDAGEAMRACTFFHTNAATANRMILRMIDFLSGVDEVASGEVCDDSPPSPPNLRSHRPTQKAANGAAACRTTPRAASAAIDETASLIAAMPD